MKRVVSILVLICWGIFPAFSQDLAYAQKLYRCDGYVQTRPCDQALGFRPQIQSGSSARAMPRTATVDVAYPKVLREVFKPVSSKVGNWRGEIQGKGKVTLRLRVFRNGSLESERFMGSVVLPRLKTTTFNFNSSMPHGTGWSWKVVALAEL